MSVLFTTPIAKRTIWGGKTLRKFFHFPEDFGDDVGQAWVFSAQPGDSNILHGDSFDGWTLEQLWHERPELFHSKYGKFPFIISLVAPEDDLSIQVHPDDAYAQAHGHPCGKNEAWYFLHAPSSGHILYGHHAADLSAAKEYIANEQWTDMVRTLDVAADETVYIPAGTLHALSNGSIVYEIQQSTDVTYRFYDYDRTDAQGRKRPLQLEDAIACLHYDQPTIEQAKPAPQSKTTDWGRETICVQSDSFVVRRLDVAAQGTLCYPMYFVATVVAGAGLVNGQPVQVGTNFLVPAGETVFIQGNVTLLTTAEE